MTESAIPHLLASALESVGVEDAVARLAGSSDVTFEQLDVDSLGIIEIVARISTESGIEIPDEELAKLHSPADILAYCSKAPAQAA
jgi:acyl carrier protein